MSYKVVHCSFCHKSSEQVQTIVAGPTVAICDECVDLCARACGDNREKRRQEVALFVDVQENGT